MKSPLLISVVVFGAVIIESSASSDDPEVETPLGKIRGSLGISRLGRQFYSFRGIRYAQPPTGQQRFQVPIPVEDWQDVIDATKEGPACPSDPLNPNMSEDCLRLNVYTNKLPTTNHSSESCSKEESELRSVLVFIHGGAFYSMSSQSFYLGPEYIVDKDIVLVTINYRLGVLGMISTGDSLAPGNLAFKDQVEALRWIRRNIFAFGGDPNSVTISGHSAGSLCVILHMISPMSAGLFHKAIAMSAAPVVNAPLFSEQKDMAIKQADLLGCPTDTTGAMLVCMNSKPVENFTSTKSKFYEWRSYPLLLWEPVVEPEVEGIERFLSAHPLDLIRQGQFSQVPLIIGCTEQELIANILMIDEEVRNGDHSALDDLNKNWTTIMPIIMRYERETPRSRVISDELRRFYFKGKEIGPETYDNLEHIFSDLTFNYNIHHFAKAIAIHSSKPVYFYKFTFQGRRGFAMKDGKAIGVGHHDDLQYLFYLKMFFPKVNESEPEAFITERHITMWSNFAKTGKPIIPGNGDVVSDVKWDRFEPEKDNYLEIDSQLTMKTGIFPDRMQKLKEIFHLTTIPIRFHDSL